MIFKSQSVLEDTFKERITIKFYIIAVSFKVARFDRNTWHHHSEIAISLNIEMDLINTFEYSKKILRDIKFLAIDKNYRKRVNLKDNSTKRLPSSILLIDDLKSINLQPKEIRNLNLNVSFEEDFEEILDSNWYLQYSNLNNSIRKIRINKLNHKTSIPQ